MTVPTSIRSLIEEIRASAHKNAEELRRKAEQIDVLLADSDDSVGGDETGIPARTRTTALIEEGSIWINGEELKEGAHVDRFEPIAKDQYRTLEIGMKKVDDPRYYTVEVPEGRALTRLHVTSGKTAGVVVIGYYDEAFAAATDDPVTCIRCGSTIICGINPQCGDTQPYRP